MKQLIGGFGAFIIVLVLALLLMSKLQNGFWRYVIMLIPIFPVIYIGFSIARAVSEMDELQRRIQLEAIAFSLANTSLLTFFLGLMQINTGTQIDLTWVLPIAAIFWGVGIFIAGRRYK